VAKLSLDATGMCGSIRHLVFFTGKKGPWSGGGAVVGGCPDPARRAGHKSSKSGPIGVDLRAVKGGLVLVAERLGKVWSGFGAISSALDSNGKIKLLLGGFDKSRPSR